MTSLASSLRRSKTRPFRPWAHAFGQALRDNALMTVVSFLIYFGVIVGTVIGETTGNHYEQPLTDRLRYTLFDSTQLSLLMPAIIAVLSILQGVLVFRFLYRKKAVNAWFGMGITRGALFTSRFAAGLLGLLLPIILPMATSLIINLSIFRDSGLILSRFFYLLSGMCVQATVIFCITAIVCVTSGTLLESIWHSIVFVSIPSIVFVALNGLMAKFLLGNSVGVTDQGGLTNFFEIFGRLLALNPLAFTYQAFWRFATEQAAPGYYSYWPNTTVNYLPILGWLAAALALAWLAHRLMGRIKTENAGVRGSGKITGFISVMTVALLAFSIPFLIPNYVIGRLPDWMVCGFSCLAAGIVFVCLALALKLVGRSAGKGWLTLPIGLASMLAVVGLFYTGCFGYSGYTPDISDVKSVTITYKGDGAIVPKQSYASGSLLYPAQQLGARVDLTIPDDMALALQLHKDLIMARHLSFDQSENIDKMVFGSGINISYTLNDGRKVTRTYQKVRMDILTKMLALDGTAGVKALIRDYMSGKYTGGDDGREFRDSSVYISSRFLAKTDYMYLDTSKRTELLECIISDLESQSVQTRYFPQKPEACVLHYAHKESGFIYGTDIPQESSDIIVTDDFTHTIAFLVKNGFESYLNNSPQVEEIDLVDYRNMIRQNIVFFDMFNPLFYGSAGRKSTIDEVVDDKYFGSMFRNMMRITDPSQINEILASCRSKYFCSDGGYVVYIKHKGQDKMTSAFLPARDAPEFVRQNAR